MIPLRLSFTLRIQPTGKARPIVTRHGTFMPKPYDAWRDLVRWQVRSQVPSAVLSRLPLVGLLSFAGTFSWPSSRGGCPDLDNALGALWDAIQVPPRRMSKGKVPVMKGGGWGLFQNDSQIKRLERTEIIGGPSAITFTVSEIVP